MERSRPASVTALAVFFAAGAAIALLSAAALLSPGGALEPMWRLNPSVLMAAVSAACLGTSILRMRASATGRSRLTYDRDVPVRTDSSSRAPTALE